MKTWRIGKGTLSIGLIGIGILLLLNYSEVISNNFFQYVGPIYIILFGIEVIWSYIRNRDQQRQKFSAWSIIILVAIFISSSTHMVFPSNFNWQPRLLSAVEGKVPLENGITHVVIRIPQGKVEVTGIAGQEITYTGELLTNGSSQEEADQALKTDWKIQKNGDTLELVLEQKGPKWNLISIFDWTQKKAFLTVQIPRSLLTNIETKNGTVQVSDMNGDSEVKTSNGAITMINVKGNVKAETSNGSGTFTDITGSLEMHTNNGGLTLKNISGSVTAESSNGSIKGSSMVNGNWECTTSNGRITLAIPKDANAEIEAKTSNGSVGGDLEWQSGEKTHRTSKIGSGFNQITLESSNGSIDVDYLK